MDVLSSRLERLERHRLKNHIALRGNELNILKQEFCFDLVLCGGWVAFVVSALYWLIASNTLPPLLVIAIGSILLTLCEFAAVQKVRGHCTDRTPLSQRACEAFKFYLQLWTWPKLAVQLYREIREANGGDLFYILWICVFFGLHDLASCVSGIMALYLLLIGYIMIPLFGILLHFDWVLSITSKEEENLLQSEESLLPEPTEENEKLWELSVADEVEEKSIIEEFQPSLSGLQLGSEMRLDDDESIGFDLQLDQQSLPDIDDTSSSCSSLEDHNVDYSVRHFNSSGSDDTTDNITSKLEDASKEAVSIPPSRKTMSKSSNQREGRDSDDGEEGLDVESFEVISREEFNL